MPAGKRAQRPRAFLPGRVATSHELLAGVAVKVPCVLSGCKSCRPCPGERGEHGRYMPQAAGPLPHPHQSSVRSAVACAVSEPLLACVKPVRFQERKQLGFPGATAEQTAQDKPCVARLGSAVPDPRLSHARLRSEDGYRHSAFLFGFGEGSKFGRDLELNSSIYLAKLIVEL